LLAQYFDGLVLNGASGCAGAKTFAFLDVFFKLTAFFGLEAFAVGEALLRFHLEASVAFGAGFAADRSGRGGSAGAIGIGVAGAEHFQGFFVHITGFLGHGGREEERSDKTQFQ
jgi:hypothetical protein